MKPPNRNSQARTVVAHSKNRPSMQTTKRPTPVAPPVYRPQAKPATAQPKMPSGVVMRKQPVAPPVYRPQPLPRVMQTKMPVTRQAHSMKLGRTGVDNAGVVQRFKLKNYRAYEGILAGDPGINADKVRAMVASLRDGKPLPGKIKIAKAKLMAREGPLSKHWDEYDPGEDDKLKAQTFWVVTDGHHRFVAYVEADMNPLAHCEEGGQAEFAYSWNELGNIDEDL